MLKKTLSPSLFMLAVFVCVTWINGCKKSEHTPVSAAKPSTEVPQAVLNAWKKEGYSSTYIVNKKIPAIFIDENGNEKHFTKNSRALATCDQDADDFVDNTFYMQAQQIGYSCGVGYTVQINYIIITAFTPVLANPSNPSQLSRGRFRLKNSAGTVIWTNSAVTPVYISYVGPDIFDASKSVYQVSYVVTDVPDVFMEGSASNENRPIIYSSCSDVITTPADWQAGVFYGSPSACAKIDNIHITPSGSGGLVYFGGCDYQINTGNSCYPASAAASRPDEHDIEWRKPGDATYGNFPSAPILLDFSNLNATFYLQRVSFPLFPPCSTMPYRRERLEFFGVFSYVFPVTGTIEIRYRNVKLNTPINSCSTMSCTTGGWVTTTINVQ